MTVGENINFALKRQVNRLSSKEIAKLVRLNLERVGLEDAEKKMPKNYPEE